jgi:hypothetical protein
MILINLIMDDFIEFILFIFVMLLYVVMFYFFLGFKIMGFSFCTLLYAINQ